MTQEFALFRVLPHAFGNLFFLSSALETDLLSGTDFKNKMRWWEPIFNFAIGFNIKLTLSNTGNLTFHFYSFQIVIFHFVLLTEPLLPVLFCVVSYIL